MAIFLLLAAAALSTANSEQQAALGVGATVVRPARIGAPLVTGDDTKMAIEASDDIGVAVTGGRVREAAPGSLPRSLVVTSDGSAAMVVTLIY